LIREATRAMTTSPEHALVLLRDHERRFPRANVALRNELLRHARALLAAAPQPPPHDR